MKKQVNFILFILVIVLLLLSFKSKTANITPHFQVKKEVMTDAYLQIYTTFYAYDREGRAIRSEAQNPDTLVIATSYPARSIVTVTHNSATPRYDTMIYDVNSQGMVIRDNMGNTFEYNTNGKLIKGAEGETYTWRNGDMITRSYNTTNGSHVVRYTYTNLPDTRDFGDYMWGFQCEHLVETVIDSPEVTRHRYIVDNQDRVITDSAGTSIHHYTY